MTSGGSQKEHTPHQWRDQQTPEQQIDQYITEAEQTGDTLQESERCFHAVWTTAFDAMALSTPDGTVVAANPAYYRLYGYPQEEVLGKSFCIIFPEEQRTWVLERYRDMFQSPTISPCVEATVIRTDGTECIVESCYSFIVHNGKRTTMLSIIRDITERKKTEKVLREQEVKLHVNELKDQLLTHMSHELRTPLTAVSGYLDLLQVHHKELDGPTKAAFFYKAVDNCNELAFLINIIEEAMHLTNEVRPAKREELVVAQVVREVLGEFDAYEEQEHPLQMEISEQITVWADKQYFRQILRNLLSNAFKYAPKQTPVVIGAALRGGASLETEAPEQVCISVKDAGLGIPSAELPLLFEKFGRLKRDVGGTVRGTGLGLYISKQLVEAMGEHIWVESSGVAGEGSRFCFTLPVAARATRYA